MSWLVDREMRHRGQSYKSYIADEIKQFVACRFVYKIAVGCIEETIVNAEITGVLVKDATKPAHLPRTEFLTDEHQRVVKTSALDKVEMEKRQYFV